MKYVKKLSRGCCLKFKIIDIHGFFTRPHLHLLISLRGILCIIHPSYPIIGIWPLALTWSVPTKVHGFGRRSGGDPQGEQAHHHTAKICQKVGCVGHDGQAVGQVATCREITRGWDNEAPAESIYKMHSSIAHSMWTIMFWLHGAAW